MKKTNLKSDLQKLYEMLPHGSNVIIAKKTGFSRITVSNVLNGIIEMRDKHISIIEAAQKIIQDSEKHKNSAITKLNEFLSKSKA